MIFLILSFVSGLALAAAPFYAARRLRNRWKMPKGLFLKAGLACLGVEVVQMAAIGNATSIWPQILEWPSLAKAVVLGSAAGLFTELGRFLVLDKFMKSVRRLNEGIYFALGWSGIATALIGTAIVLGAAGMVFFTSIGDLAASYPDASKADIEQLEFFRQQAADLMNGSPLIALSPLLERATAAAMDITLTLLMLLSYLRGEIKYVWAAVGMRALYAGMIIFASSINEFLAEGVILAAGIAAYLLVTRLVKAYASKNYPAEGRG